MGDQVNQAPGVGAGSHGAAHHVDDPSVDGLEVCKGGCRFNLLGQVERAPGLLAEQVRRVDHANQLLLFVNNGQAMNVVLGHLEDGFKDIGDMTNRGNALMHDITHL